MIFITVKMPARKTKKGKKKDKQWYNILAPQMFGKTKVAETLADDPNKMIGRKVETSFQTFTDDFSKAHIKLHFKVSSVKGLDAQTIFTGHSMTSDYMRRIIRRKQSKVEGIYDVKTKDDVRLRIKPVVLTGRRIKASQKRLIRACMNQVILEEAKKNKFDKFSKGMLDGNLGREMYSACKKIFPVKRIELCKSRVMSPPMVSLDEEITSESIEEQKPETTEEQKPETTEEQKPETTEEQKPETTEEQKPETTEEQKPETTEEQPTKEKKTKKKK
jgi:small subunit ribosomal protein S3Ae